MCAPATLAERFFINWALLGDLARLLLKAQTADVQLTIRDYRAADFDRLWQIDQLCFPVGIAYTQMDLTGFIMKRDAITLVAEIQPANANARRHNMLPPTMQQSPVSWSLSRFGGESDAS